MEAAPPIRLRKMQSPFAMPDSWIRKDSSKPCWSNLVFKIFTPVILVISVAYFPEKSSSGFIYKLVLSRSWEITYLLVAGIVVCYALFGRRSFEKMEDMEISSVRSSMAYFAEYFDFDCVSDFGFDHGYSDSGMSENGLVPNLGDEWLGLPVRSLQSFVTQNKGFKRGNGGFCGSGSNCCEGDWEERNRTFGDLGPLNLLERFNEASVLLSPISW